MAVSLTVFLMLVLFFAMRGFTKGFFGALSGILGLIGGYAAALFCTRPLAVLLQEHANLEGLLVYVLASFVAFVTAGFIITSIFTQIEQLLMSRQILSISSKLGGLLVGVIVGGVVGLLAVYALSIYHEFKQPEVSNDLSKLDTASRKIISKATAAALSRAYPEASKMTTAIAENPVKISQSVNRVLKNNDLQTLLRDKRYQALLTSGNIEQLQQSPVFQQLAKDPDMQYLLKHSNIAQDGESNEQALAVKMTAVAQRIAATRNDTRIQAIINDPEFQKKLQNENKFALMTDPQLVKLAELVFAAGSSPDQDTAENSGQKSSAETSTKIYRSIDEEGNTHFSDKPFK